MIAFFGTVHNDGGCGSELLGAIELLRLKKIPVRLISPPKEFPQNSHAGNDYLKSIGVELIDYELGTLKACGALMSFGEGEKLFPLIREGDRPKYVVYSDCMHFPCDTEVDAYREGLFDEFFFQTRRLADRIGPEIARRTQKAVRVRTGYKAFINPNSDYFPLRFTLIKPNDFTVIKVARDHEEKWHPETWRMFCGINAPSEMRVQIEVAGFGEEAAKKAGNIESVENRWHGQMNLKTHSHVYDPKELADLFNRAHVLIHVCDYEWEEALGRVILEASVAGTVVITDNRGGAVDLIRHGETGFLVNSSDEAAYYASKMAFEPKPRAAIAERAYAQITEHGHGNVDACWPWWEDLLTKV